MQMFKFLLIAVLSLSSLFANAKTKKETVKVWGNCGMCQSRIEKAAKLAGASSAEWNVETHILTVVYDDANSSPAAIESRIAEVGHDTQSKAASKDAYSKLPGCCQYERKETSSASASCCAAGASCCASGQACCTQTASTAKADVDCCVSGASCCGAGKECCSKTKAVTASIKDCCAAGASCCVAGASCCNKTAKVDSVSSSDCCSTGGDCCTTSPACCKIAA